MTYTLGGGMSEEDAAETCRGRVGRAGLATPPGPAGRMIVVPAERSEGAGSFPTWGRNKVRNIFSHSTSIVIVCSPGPWRAG